MKGNRPYQNKMNAFNSVIFFSLAILSNKSYSKYDTTIRTNQFMNTEFNSYFHGCYQWVQPSRLHIHKNDEHFFHFNGNIYHQIFAWNLINIENKRINIIYVRILAAKIKRIVQIILTLLNQWKLKWFELSITPSLDDLCFELQESL